MDLSLKDCENIRFINGYESKSFAKRLPLMNLVTNKQNILGPRNLDKSLWLKVLIFINKWFSVNIWL